MEQKWIKLLVPVALAALLLTGCSFRRDDASSDESSSTLSDMSSGTVSRPVDSMESGFNDTMSQVQSDLDSLASGAVSAITPGGNESSSHVSSATSSR